MTQPMTTKDPALQAVQRIYHAWGRQPWLYVAQDWVTFLGQHRRIRRRAVAALHACPGDRVLEIGCGSGRNFADIEERLGPGGTLIGFDYSPDMLAAAGQLAQRHGWHNIQLIQGDAAELAVGTTPFDAVLFAFSLSVIPDYHQALGRAWEVLRPGGTLVICDAQMPGGPWQRLKPLLDGIYRPLAGWHSERNLLAALGQIAVTMQVEWFNGGTVYVAAARKPAEATGHAP